MLEQYYKYQKGKHGFRLTTENPVSKGAMNCPRCNHLVTERESRARTYSTILSVLTTEEGQAEADEYNRLRIAVDGARMDFEVARLELEMHQRAHSKAN